jgi:hypothetical protein
MGNTEDNQIASTLSAMTGLQCMAARIRHYLNIVLGFEELFEEEGLRSKQTRWTWEVMSWDGIWRVTKLNRLVFSSGSEESVIAAQLPSLIGLTVDRVDTESFQGDLRVHFTDGTTLEILKLAADNATWSIKGPTQWFPDNGAGAELTEQEEQLSAHAEACFTRWQQTVPMDNKERGCKQCVYYHHLQWASYFWDFGVCTNVRSEYDGKVVNIGSTCNGFSISFANISSEEERKNKA